MLDKKLRAGVITIHDIYNYGSILQAYSTLKVLENFGIDAELIDYKFPNDFHNPKTSRLKLAVSETKSVVNRTIKSLLPGNPYRRYKQGYVDFKKKHYRLSRRYNTHEELMTTPPDYDVYISGSDQIWRPKFTRGDAHFFLQFAGDRKKIAYSSSFGCLEIEPAFLEKYATYLSSFDAIGVREEVGVEIVEKLTGCRAELVLDPTLLLGHEEWLSVAKPYWRDPPKRPYIACYGFHPSSKFMLQLGNFLSKKLDMDIVHIGGKSYNYFSRNTKHLLDVAPAEWLDVLNGASFILAQSFHGTAFAVNFSKPFLSILRGDENHDSRQRQLVASLGLCDRLIYIDTDFDAVYGSLNDIDYCDAHKRLADQKEKSLNFLRNALQKPEAQGKDLTLYKTKRL